MTGGPVKRDLRPVRPPRLPRHPLPRRLPVRHLPARRPGDPRRLPRLRHHPGITRPPPRRLRPHLPRLRRHHPPLHLPALRLRRQPGRRAALPPLRPSPRPSPRSSAPPPISPRPCDPLAEALAAAPNPAATARWLATPHIRGLLDDLITGRLPLTHQALAARPAALRDLPARPPAQLRRAATHRPAARRLRRLGAPPPRRPGRPPARTAAAPVQPLAPAPPHARPGRHRAAAAQRPQIRRAALHPGRELPVLDRRTRPPARRTSPRPISTPGTPPPPFTKNKAPAVSSPGP